MMGCRSASLTCLQGGKAAGAGAGVSSSGVSSSSPGVPGAAAACGGDPTTGTLHKLALATGGTEKSWYRCVFPFGVVALVIGVAATGITFSLGGPPALDVAKAVSVAALLAGLALLAAALLCWRAKRRRRRRRAHQEQQQHHPQQHQTTPEPGAL